MNTQYRRLEQRLGGEMRVSTVLTLLNVGEKRQQKLGAVGVRSFCEMTAL